MVLIMLLLNLIMNIIIKLQSYVNFLNNVRTKFRVRYGYKKNRKVLIVANEKKSCSSHNLLISTFANLLIFPYFCRLICEE